MTNQKEKISPRLTGNGGVFEAGVGGGVNPSPREEGKGEVGSYQYSMLNHLSPGAGGILMILKPFYIELNDFNNFKAILYKI